MTAVTVVPPATPYGPGVLSREGGVMHALRTLVVTAVIAALAPAGSAAARGMTAGVGEDPVRGLARSAAAGNLVYHGGPVMRTVKTYVVYWVPSGRSIVAGYRSTINRYFVDAARDSGGTANVYGVQTQYYDTTGPIAYAQSFGGSTTATAAFPANGCRAYAPAGRVCLTGAQVLAELRRVMAAKGWTGGPTHAFVVFLPASVGTCQDAAGSACAFTSFCGYHDWSGSGAAQVIWADIPYADTAPGACAAGERPNGTDADDTLNIASHEHREMIEDPRGTAWYDAAGAEGSDRCAWTFGAALGRTATGAYNEVIDGHDYWLQEEWSNAGSRCLQRPAAG